MTNLCNNIILVISQQLWTCFNQSDESHNYLSYKSAFQQNKLNPLFNSSAFDPFGSGPAPAPKPQDFMGAFLGPGNMGQPDPFLHAARSPSPTMQNMGMGKACAFASQYCQCVGNITITTSKALLCQILQNMISKIALQIYLYKTAL